MDNRILLVDDEWYNIESLEVAIENAFYSMGITQNLRDYASDGYEAVRKLIEAEKRGEKYGVIITDNHLRSDEGIGIDGDDLVGIITGELGWTFSRDENDLGMDLSKYRKFSEVKREVLGDVGGGSNIVDFLKDSYETMQQYLRVTNYHFGSTAPYLIFLCGNPDELKIDGLEEKHGVKCFRKCSGGKRSRTDYCEREVMDYLAHLKIFDFAHVQSAFNHHPRFTHNVNHATYKHKTKPKAPSRKK